MPPNPNLLNGLLAFWKLDETSGTRADYTGVYDLSENGGTVTGGNFNPQFNPTSYGGTRATSPSLVASPSADGSSRRSSQRSTLCSAGNTSLRRMASLTESSTVLLRVGSVLPWDTEVRRMGVNYFRRSSQTQAILSGSWIGGTLSQEGSLK
jgi:hypothetical protein